MRAEITALDLPVGDQLLHDLVRHVDRNCKTNADIAAALGIDGGIDTDQFTAQIDQGTAGIARVD